MIKDSPQRTNKYSRSPHEILKVAERYKNKNTSNDEGDQSSSSLSMSQFNGDNSIASILLKPNIKNND